VHALSPNSEFDCFSGGLERKRNNGVNPSQQSGNNRRASRAGDRIAYAFVATICQLEHDRFPKKLSDPHTQRCVHSVLMNMPEVEVPPTRDEKYPEAHQ